MISLLIADDNKNFDINLFNFIKKVNNKINILGIAVNGLDTYEKIKSLKPDVVLLDIKMPILNGFQVIEKLIEENINMPKIIVVTAHYDLLSSYKCLNSIYGIFFKPINYNSLIKFLNTIIEEENYSNINDDIINVLSNFDFNIKSKGYKYLIECIKACRNSPYLINNLERKLYPHIASQFMIANPSKVKWSIEKSLNSMYRYTDNKILEKFFPNSKKLSPKYFIETIISSTIKFT